MMVPESHLQRNEWHASLSEPSRADEGFPIPRHRSRRVRIHELVAAGSVSLKGLWVLLTEVESPPCFAAGQHVQSLAREDIQRAHFSARIDIASQRVQFGE